MREYDEIRGYGGKVFEIARLGDALRIVDAADFGLDETRPDNGDALTKAFEFCRQNPGTELCVRKGIYRFRRRFPMTLEGARDVRIEGNGAEFVFTGGGGYLRFRGCEAVELRNLILDWDWTEKRLASLVQVIRVSPEDGFVDFLFPEVSEIEPGFEWYTMNQFDPLTLTPGVKGGKEYWFWREPYFYVEKARKIGPNVLRVYHDGRFNALAPGEVYLIRHETYGRYDRLQPYGTAAVEILNCVHATLRNVTVHSVPGMAFRVGEGTRRYQLLGCRVGLRPGAGDRRVSAAADALHIADTGGFGRIEGCDFSFMGDDGINIHDNIAVAESAPDAFTRIVKGWMPCREGDVLGIKRDDFSDTGVKAAVARVIERGQGCRLLRFAEPLPADAGPGSIFYNPKYDSGNYVIRDNFFHENRARGLLLQAGNGLTEGNRFYKTQGAAVLILVDVQPDLWAEGTGVENLEIRENRFELCDVNDWTALIGLKATVLSGKVCKSVFRNILFERNTFAAFPQPCFFLSSAENVRIRENRFFDTRPDNAADGLNEIIVSEHSEKISVENNLYFKFGKAVPETEGFE